MDFDRITLMKKIVLITGSSSGIGKATALQNGFIVYAGSRTPEQIEIEHENLYPIRLDLTNLEQLNGSINEIYKKHNYIDIVINNAGYGLVSAIEDATEEQMKNQFDINVFSIFRVCKIVIPRMKERRSGFIINMSSYLGEVALPLMSYYSASKFAVEGLTEALRYELKDQNIKVYSVLPWFIKTDFTKDDLVENKNDVFRLGVSSKMIDKVNKGASPLIVAKAILELIDNPKSKSKVYVGKGENKILSMKNELEYDDFLTTVFADTSAQWKSLFYNISDSRYQTSFILKNSNESIKRVDISSGIVSFDISLKKHRAKNIDIAYMDKMVAIVIVEKGTVTIVDNECDKETILEENRVHLIASSKQNSSITMDKAKESTIFLLLISDFILKRYLSNKENEPIDFLYQKIQHSPYINLLNTQPIDALTLYMLKRIKERHKSEMMQSISGEHRTVELMLYRFSLLDFIDRSIDKDSLAIAMKVKEHLLENFISPPKVEYIAHLCSTNKTKLNTVFKKVYKMTIANYVKKLRLENANILLREESLTIGEVAKKVGYQHQGNFTKLFFDYYGVYPKELIKH